jgi:hydrogenase expression/formation protein HypD
MKYLDEYRDADVARRYLQQIRAHLSRPWTLMEVCGGQTHSIVRYGLDLLLPSELSLLHGPGCPVCVTPIETIDAAVALATLPGLVFCSFGDMLRVPGSEGDLFAAKAKGADVRVVYSPLDAVEIAAVNPTREVVFFAVGFETTAPANAMVVSEAKRRGLRNFSLLVSHVSVPPAMKVILETTPRRVDGFLAAGHVCTIMGTDEYVALAQRYRVPIVVTGFEPVDILQGILMCIEALEKGRHGVENQYSRSVQSAGNMAARSKVGEVFQVGSRVWRGIGAIPDSGLVLRPEFAEFDAERRFDLAQARGPGDDGCRSGEVLMGLLKPEACSAFGSRCTPEHPLGATMVSGEGACAAYYRYRRRAVVA